MAASLIPRQPPGLRGINGEVNHATRGILVRQFNAVTGTANGFMYFVAALIAIFAIITVKFAFGKSHED